MNKQILENVVDDLIRVHTVIHRYLLKIGLDSVNAEISRLHFVIMVNLDESGTLPVSAIGKKLRIPGPQMTHLIDKLIELEMVDRQHDDSDRRIINISLTAKGKQALEDSRKLIRDTIRQKLSCLDDRELEDLAFSLRKLTEIGAKLE